MIPDIKLNNISMLNLGWLRESINFPAPQSQSNTIVVPGRNSPIRYTEAFGRVSYQPRSFDITLSMLGTREKFNQMSEQIVNRFAGRLVDVILSEKPALYYVGTLEITPGYDPLAHKGQLTISSSDADAYRYHTEETVAAVTGGGNVILLNDFMPAVPTVTVTEETTLKWQVGTDRFIKTVSAGTWTFPELELVQGENEIEITTAGTVTFRYREGRL
ncbi:hypothetical protein D3Z38_02005 [Clostridiales bacterium]|jgi:hypothetical protein|nr:hypothetical protein [Clostridiales bacterium]